MVTFLRGGVLSHKEIRVIKDAYSIFESVPDKVFLTLPERRCLIGALQSTDPDEVYEVDIRPTASYADGETVRGG